MSLVKSFIAKPFACFLILVAFAQAHANETDGWIITQGGASGGERRVALAIGNGAYLSTGPLANPVADAALMASSLRALSFDVIELYDGDQKRMKRAIQAFGERLEDAGDRGVGPFYYAGHGIQAGGANYLIPVDAAMKRETDLEIEAVEAN